FGLCARIRTRQVAYKGTRRTAYEIELMAAGEIVRFAEEIGISSKDEQVSHLVERCRARGTGGWKADTLPLDVWDDVSWAKGDRSWRSINVAAVKPLNHNWHVDKRSPRRETVLELSNALDAA